MSANDYRQGQDTGVLRQALEDASDLFLIVDPASEDIVYINPAASQFLLGSELAFVPKAVPSLPRISSPEGQVLRLADLVSDGLVDVRLHSSDGAAEVRARASSFSRQGRQLLMLVGRLGDEFDPLDPATSEMLRRQRGQAQKMETISQMASGIAHDFNNILASVLGYTELARERFGRQCPDKLLHYLQEVQQAGERARDLLGRLMDYSHLEECEAEPLAVCDFLAGAEPLLRSTLTSGMVMQWKMASDLPSIRVDPQQLRQAVISICLNARDACDARGSLTIVADIVESSDGECVSCHRAVRGPWVRLGFEDDGAGIHPADMERVFDPFFTTRRGARRSGLGLSMVHGVVHRAGGHIELRSRLGAGSRIDLLFPVAAAAQGVFETRLPGDREAATDDLRGLRVMVVDDEPALVDLLADVLSNLGCHVLAYTDSTEALADFSRNPQSIDVLFTDQTMPGITGTELTEGMRDLRPALPVVLISGDSLRVTEEGLRAQGIQYFMPKPMDLQKVAELLRKIRDGG
ncbi:MAG: response regulator [Chromatiales bacterium]|nr:response regulator [Chromatiales bacterium]